MGNITKEKDKSFNLPCDFVYCPYSPGVLISLPGENFTQVSPSNERRKEKDRRKDNRSYPDRRFLNTPSCPQYGLIQCPHKRYPALIRWPELLFTLCHSQSILNFIDNTILKEKAKTACFEK